MKELAIFAIVLQRSCLRRFLLAPSAFSVCAMRHSGRRRGGVATSLTSLLL